MPRLSVAEKIELAAIPAGALSLGLAVPADGLRAETGTVVAAAALVLLLQGFLRDLWLLRRARKTKIPTKEARCLCVESAIGLCGVLAGVGLVGLGLAGNLAISRIGVVATTAAILAAGFVLKDFVVSWSPWRIYREKNHGQLIVRWGK